MIYAFESYELDTGLHELRCASGVVPLEPLVFNVLTYLVQHRDHAVTKDELIAHLWRGQCMQDGVLVQSVVKARRAVGDNGHAQRCIKTIMGYGYRFIAPVEEYDACGQQAQARASIPRQSVVPSLGMSRSKVPWQAEDELWVHELPVTDRGNVRAILHALLRQVDEHQAQVVLLVRRLGVSDTREAKRERPWDDAASYALQHLTQVVALAGRSAVSPEDEDTVMLQKLIGG